jgi:predicted small secreted protein
MKNTIQVIALLLVAASTTGCASTKGYFVDRGRDVADVLTATVGVGVGAKARVGPLDAGLLVDFPVTGLKCGRCFLLSHMPLKLPPAGDLQWVLYEQEWFQWNSTLERDDPRNKDFLHMADIGEPLELIFNTPHTFNPDHNWRVNWSYETQIEVVVGLGPTLRLGLNPGELADFLLGWFGIDILKDDLEARKKTESNQASEVTARKLAEPQR